MFSSVTSWWSKGNESAEDKENVPESNETELKKEITKEQQDAPDQPTTTPAGDPAEDNKENVQSSPSEELSEASIKAMNAAKDWGSEYSQCVLP